MEAENRPDVEAAAVDLQLVVLVALHQHMLVPLMPLKLPSLHTGTIRSAYGTVMPLATGTQRERKLTSKLHPHCFLIL